MHWTFIQRATKRSGLRRKPQHLKTAILVIVSSYERYKLFWTWRQSQTTSTICSPWLLYLRYSSQKNLKTGESRTNERVFGQEHCITNIYWHILNIIFFSFTYTSIKFIVLMDISKQNYGQMHWIRIVQLYHNCICYFTFEV